jgi:hypothetical protein
MSGCPVAQARCDDGDYLRGVTNSDPPIQSAMPKPGLIPLELAQDLVARIEQGNAYARSRKNRFRSSSTVVRMISLILTVTSTIILGLQKLNVWTGIAFSLVAVVTSVNALEPFFAWRSRWVLMEEARTSSIGCVTRLPITLRPANQISWMYQGFRKCLMSTSKSGTSSVTAGWSIGEHREHDDGEGGRTNPSHGSVRRALSWLHRCTLLPLSGSAALSGRVAVIPARGPG